MNVKVSKVMAKEIAKFLVTQNHEFEANVTTHSEAWYQFNMDWKDSYEDTDFDYNTGEYKVITIIRPYNWYAPPVHLSTRMLKLAYKKCNGTLDDFIKTVWTEYIEC